jgi:hypothetical protein
MPEWERNLLVREGGGSSEPQPEPQPETAS